MVIIDGHCDVLWKMYENPLIDFYAPQQAELDVNYENMMKSGIKIQCFAIYLPESIKQPKFDDYLEYINIFYQKIAIMDKLTVIKNQSDLQQVMNGTKVGAILTLEGADAINDHSLYTQILFRLGVRMIGVTWNYANWAADGILEARKGGFSKKGKRFIKECNDLGIILDASHLSVRSFWDLADHSKKPFVATHSNAYAVCPHPRNLNDDQIRALITRGGRIGITFVPWFVSDKGDASISRLMKHIEHVCALGGEKQVVLGSDFDGFNIKMPGLEHAGQLDNLAQQLSRYYKDQIVENFLYRNWLTFFETSLPIS
ncbi:dipeptidase [Paenibacillus radicis (ex Xue et al. 2023)]|uniref:Dipeptidase n=1 Tax=Paenibacillus radicis (ex Xue et al. 2023) TaxID=2972489 RepID=A0ABT1YC11_9BACL|nr:dipeptidase [Paenibacillus radicis (ex Xue et al. 2023)]MCR8630730.1 dipeptidase [Paenibacillus radicis (ex Xue et al. 2023)]